MPAGSNMIFGMNGNKLMAGGENGNAEAIIPLNKLWDEMDKNFAKHLGNNNSGPVNITVQVGTEKLGTAVVKALHQLERQTGNEYLLT